MKTLRLLVTDKCNRKCKGCCNKDWDIKNLPLCESYKGYKEVVITGGEPLTLDYITLKIICGNIIAESPKAKIYLYTASTKNINKFISMLADCVDGITLTLHEQKDVRSFIKLNTKLHSIKNLFKYRSMRLNIFKGIDLSNIDLSGWKIQDNMVWIKNCPLPKNEVFMRNFYN